MRRMTFEGLDEIVENMNKKNKDFCFIYLGIIATGNGLHPCLIGFPKTYPADKSIIHCTIRLSTNYF